VGSSILRGYFDGSQKRVISLVSARRLDDLCFVQELISATIHYELFQGLYKMTLNPIQIKAAFLYASGRNITETATLVGVHRVSVSRWVNRNKQFQQLVARHIQEDIDYLKLHMNPFRILD
jgi:hypothetical protein